MADREQSGHPVAGIFAVLALAVGAVIVQQQSLIGSRPSTTATVSQGNGIREDVQARLWQDPFAAVRIHRESPNGNKSTARKEGDNHVPGKLFARYGPQERLHVLIAMMNGGPYAGAEEQRRRQRYAVVSALGAVGYAPDDPEHIGYVQSQRDASADSSLPDIVPFERFTQVRKTSENDGAAAVVLYLDEDALAVENPLRQVVRFHEELTRAKGKTQWDWSVIGPASTAVLESMVRELSACGRCDELTSLRKFSFVTSQATVSDRHLIGLSRGDEAAFDDGSKHVCAKLNHKTVEHLFCRQKLNLRRITSTDDELAGLLAEELALRAAWKSKADLRKLLGKSTEQTTDPSRRMDIIADRLDELQRIVLVSEWDTPYGRQLPIAMRDALLPELALADQGDYRKQICPVPGEAATRYSSMCPILFFSYFRGLDGQLAHSAASDKQGGKDQREHRETGKESKDEASKRTAIERPVGDGQLDYLRRLGQFMARKHGDLRARGKSISAVGVLGTDVYDKLLVLQAVRNALPEALLFTTDLDTELMHPAEVRLSTRNLVVASAFGLSLRDELQAGHPPFRDTYETATYLATLTALEKERTTPSHPDSPLPRVFEIGRKTIVDLSLRLGPHAGGGGSGRSDGPPCGARNLGACSSVHPERVLPHIPTRVGIEMTLFLVFASSLLFLTFRQVRQGVLEVWKLATRSWPNFAWAASTFVGLAFLAFFSSRDIFFNDRGKPWAVMNGVSMWPTEIMRLLTWGLTCLLLHKGWSDIADSNKLLTRDFLLAEPPSQRKYEARVAHAGTWWKSLRDAWKKRTAGWVSEEAYNGDLPVGEIWRRHMEPAAFRDRILLLVVPVVLYLLSVGVLFFVLGFPVRPARGSTIWWVDTGILFLCVVSFAFLLFFVIDETRRCGSLVRRLTGCKNWPRETCKKFGQRAFSGELNDYLEDWLDVEFIGRRTEMVTRLIYYPFLVMTLMALARSTLFDNWGFPPALIAAMLAGLLIAIACALHLRSVAERARRAAHESLSRKLLIAQHDDSSTFDGPIRTLIGWVETYRVGAFCPFTQQTWLKALLIPIGSLSALPILDFLFAARV